MVEDRMQKNSPPVANISGILLNKKLMIGNEHTLLSEQEAKESVSLPGTKNVHQWKMFVRGPDVDSIVDKVEFELHPTFQPSKVTVSSPPFELERDGWGVFIVGVKVHYKPDLNKSASEFQHPLNFAASLTSNEFTV